MNFIKKHREKSYKELGTSEELVVKVPDIKEYLVREYEKGKKQEAEIKRLEKEVEAADEIKLKYDAAMVTLDEIRRREEDLNKEKDDLKKKQKTEADKTAKTRDELNSAKIIINELRHEKEKAEQLIKDYKYADEEKIETKAAKRTSCAIGVMIEGLKKETGNWSKERVEKYIKSAAMPKIIKEENHD